MILKGSTPLGKEGRRAGTHGDVQGIGDGVAFGVAQDDSLLSDGAAQGVGMYQGLLQGGMLKNHGELLTAIAEYPAGAGQQGPHLLAVGQQQASQQDQGLIAHAVPMGVVEVLEMIDVEQHQAAGNPLLRPLDRRFLQELVKGAPVADAGEGIGVAHLPEVEHVPLHGIHHGLEGGLDLAHQLQGVHAAFQGLHRVPPQLPHVLLAFGDEGTELLHQGHGFSQGHLEPVVAGLAQDFLLALDDALEFRLAEIPVAQGLQHQALDGGLLRIREGGIFTQATHVQDERTPLLIRRDAGFVQGPAHAIRAGKIAMCSMRQFYRHCSAAMVWRNRAMRQ